MQLSRRSVTFLTGRVPVTVGPRKEQDQDEDDNDDDTNPYPSQSNPNRTSPHHSGAEGVPTIGGERGGWSASPGS